MVSMDVAPIDAEHRHAAGLEGVGEEGVEVRRRRVREHKYCCGLGLDMMNRKHFDSLSRTDDVGIVDHQRLTSGGLERR